MCSLLLEILECTYCNFASVVNVRGGAFFGIVVSFAFSSGVVGMFITSAPTCPI